MKEYLDLSHTLAKKQMQEKIALELVYKNRRCKYFYRSRIHGFS